MRDGERSVRGPHDFDITIFVFVSVSYSALNIGAAKPIGPHIFKQSPFVDLAAEENLRESSIIVLLFTIYTYVGSVKTLIGNPFRSRWGRFDEAAEEVTAHLGPP